MSSVRMCDECEAIFREGEPGSSTGQITVNVEDPKTGKMSQQTRHQDRCGACTGWRKPSAKLALEAKEQAKLREAEATVAAYLAKHGVDS